MTGETKFFTATALVTLLVIVGGLFISSQFQGNNQQVKGVSIDTTAGVKLGPDNARVTLVEFSDLQCPACRAAEPAVKQVLSKFPNDVQFVYYHFPLPQHQNAKAAAELSEAAGEQGKFWQMHDLLFETQDDWAKLENPTEFFLGLSKKLELDQEKVKKALEENLYQQKIEQNLSLGNSLGVNSTPTFFLNGKKLNLTSFSQLEKEIEKELK
ncbi:DsbA family protein [Candidatus Microgenomates bacterium]|nr:DsbA family protein [Candidatus Microgenomates bacterium]